MTNIRDEFCAWVDDHLPAGWRAAIDADDSEKIEELEQSIDRAKLLVQVGEAGWTYPTWQPSYGGRGLEGDDAAAEIEDLKAHYRMPASFNLFGFGLAAPTIREWATEDQKRRLLGGMARGEMWCQLFSEPGNGSDVAGLATMAIQDGDEWVVNGQKVWTSGAHRSKRGMLIARSDPDQTKHKGITYFALDMASPGVEVRPLRQITGDAEFNEVFLTDVRIPDADRIGPRGEGWSVARTTLMNERVALSGAFAGARRQRPSANGRPRRRRTGPEALLRDTERRGTLGPAEKDRLMSLYIEGRVASFNGQRVAATRKAGAQPGPEGSTGKLFSTEYNQRMQIATIDSLGAHATAWETDDTATWNKVRAFLRSRGNSIEGGTSEIQRNILGERVLGLPREPDESKTRPWKDVPRN